MVQRGGLHTTIAVEKLVVGDVVDVKFGDRIPADIRILKSAGFKAHIYMYIKFSVLPIEFLRCEVLN